MGTELSGYREPLQRKCYGFAFLLSDPSTTSRLEKPTTKVPTHLAVCCATGAATANPAAARTLFHGAGRAAPASAASPAAIARTARVIPAALAPPPLALALALLGTAIVATFAAPQTKARLRRPLCSGTPGEGAVVTHRAKAASDSNARRDDEESVPGDGTGAAAVASSSSTIERVSFAGERLKKPSDASLLNRDHRDGNTGKAKDDDDDDGNTCSFSVWLFSVPSADPLPGLPSAVSLDTRRAPDLKRPYSRLFTLGPRLRRRPPRQAVGVWLSVLPALEPTAPATTLEWLLEIHVVVLVVASAYGAIAV